MSFFRPKLNLATAIILTESDALDLLRPLGSENIFSAVVSSDKNEIGWTSKFCINSLLVEGYSPQDDDENVRRLIRLAKDVGPKPVLMYGGDNNLLFVSRKRSELSKHFHFLLPEEKLTNQLVNKVEFQKLAAERGLPVPKSRLALTRDDLAVMSGELEYPVILKPAFAKGWTFDSPEARAKFRSYKHALKRFSSAKEMLEFAHNLPFPPEGLLVQEFIEGNESDVVSFHGYFDEHSNLLGYFVGRKIRTYPAVNGESTFIETIHEPAVVEIGRTSMQKLNFSGIVKIDLKRNPLNGSYKILEINPRYNLWEYLGAFAGVNLMTLAYHHQRGEPIQQDSPYKAGYKWLFFKRDLRAFVTHYRPNNEWSTLGYLASLRGKRIYKTFSWTDPNPWITSVHRFVVKQFRRGVQRLQNI